MQQGSDSVEIATLKWARPSTLPDRVSPQLATAADSPPTEPEWVHETRLEGFRLLARVGRDGVRWFCDELGTPELPVLEETLLKLGTDTVLDGRLVAARPDGTTSFRDLEWAINRRRTAELVYGVFDVVHWRGYDLTDVDLASRKRVLQRLLLGLSGVPGRPVRYVHHFEGHGAELFTDICRLGLPGLVCKLRTARYRSGPSPDWLDVRNVRVAGRGAAAVLSNLAGRDRPRIAARRTPRVRRSCAQRPPDDGTTRR